MEQPLVSVIIATCNRAVILKQCLDQYRHQTYPRIEIIVVDNGSTDETWNVLSSTPGVNAVRLPDNQQAEALNIAIEAARGTYLWRTDDDAYPACGTTIAEAVAHLESHPLAAVVTGLAINILQKHSVVGEYSRAYELESSDGYVLHSSFMGCTALLRRSAVVEAGGFWPVFYNEEQDLSLRLLAVGWQIHWKPTLVTHHLAAFTQASPAQQHQRWALKVLTRARLLSVYFGRVQAFVRVCLELTIEIVAAVVRGVPMRLMLSTVRSCFDEWRSAGRSRGRVLAPSVRRFALRRTMGLAETIRYYRSRIQSRAVGNSPS
jgi:biofilm PGA synthesis N-glycosyltransferase PgaC